MTTKKDEKAGSGPVNTSKKKGRGRGDPFRKNDPVTGERDERINRSGQNAKYTEFHRMLDRLFHEQIDIKKDGKVLNSMPAIEMMARQWIASNDYNKQAKALEYYVGKVPDELNINSKGIEEFVKNNIGLFTDGQIERLLKGTDPWEIVGELLSELKASRDK